MWNVANDFPIFGSDLQSFRVEDWRFIAVNASVAGEWAGVRNFSIFGATLLLGTPDALNGGNVEMEDVFTMKKTIYTPALALLGTTLLLGIAHAQTTDMPANNGTMSSDMKMTGMMDNSMMTSDADKQYLMETAQGSVYDQATSELAVQKAQSKSVQRYALRLMDDHNRLNKMLLLQANKRGLVLPLMMSDDDQTKLQTLMANNAGNDFDMAYLKEAIQINAEDVRKGNDAINASKDQQFRSLMRDYVSTEQKHLDSASAIMAGLQREMGTMNNGMMNNTTMPMNNTTAPMNNTTMPMNNTTAPMNNTTMPTGK